MNPAHASSPGARQTGGDAAVMGKAMWPAATFQIATPWGVQTKHGYAMQGLGLWLISAGSPKGRRKPKWSLTHLGTGHAVGFITGDVRTAFLIATEIATAGDWTFDGMTGFRNQFPDAAEKVASIMARHPKAFSRGAGENGDEAQAREIAMARP
jgi:hypothetical protein